MKNRGMMGKAAHLRVRALYVGECDFATIIHRHRQDFQLPGKSRRTDSSSTFIQRS